MAKHLVVTGVASAPSRRCSQWSTILACVSSIQHLFPENCTRVMSYSRSLRLSATFSVCPILTSLNSRATVVTRRYPQRVGFTTRRAFAGISRKCVGTKTFPVVAVENDFDRCAKGDSLVVLTLVLIAPSLLLSIASQTVAHISHQVKSSGCTPSSCSLPRNTAHRKSN